MRRGTDRVDLVVWGNADDGLRRLWNALTWAWAEAGGGTVMAESGPLDARGFAVEFSLPEMLEQG